MANKKGRAWKMERASVHRGGNGRAHSNKYSQADSSSKPAPRSRQRVWIGGYRKADGTQVRGHYRALAQAGS